MGKMSLANEAMVLNLSIGLWSGQKFDKKWTQDALADAGAAPQSARMNKHLIPEDAMRPILTAANALRSNFYKWTLPWKDNGDRLLTRQAYTDFMNDHAERKTAFELAARTFIEDVYPIVLDRASFRLGTRFDEGDYPAPDQLWPRYYAVLSIDPVAAAGDFRVRIDKDQAARVRQAIEVETNERIARAQFDVLRRLNDSLGRFVAAIRDDGRLRNDTLGALQEVIRVLPMLNVTGDTEISAACAKAQVLASALDGLDGPALKKNNTLRSRLREQAAEIMESIQAHGHDRAADQRDVGPGAPDRDAADAIPGDAGLRYADAAAGA
jgi:hypothetical protein